MKIKNIMQVMQIILNFLKDCSFYLMNSFKFWKLSLSQLNNMRMNLTQI
jgi:hypothetical protein